MGLNLEHLPRELAEPMRAYARRRRAAQVGRVLLAAGAVYLGLLILATAIDRFSFLETGGRWALFLLVHGGAAAAGLAGLAWLHRTRPNARAIAYALEAEWPEATEERFVTLENVLTRTGGGGAGGAAPAMLAALRATALDRLAAGPAHPAPPRDRGLWIAGAALLLAALACGLLSIPERYGFPAGARRVLMPTAAIPRASFVELEVGPHPLVIGTGDEAVLEAEMRDHTPALLKPLLGWLGLAPGTVHLARAPESAGPPDLEAAEPMRRVRRDLYLYTAADLQEGFRYRARAGDALTPVQRVRVVPLPRVTDLEVTLTPPPLVKEAPTTITGREALAETLELWPGTELALRFRTNQPITEAAIRRERAEELVRPDWNEAEREGTYEMTLTEDETIEIRLTNEHEFTNRQPARIAFAVRRITNPSVRLQSPGGDVSTVPGDMVAVRAQVKDDLGVEQVVIRYQLNPGDRAETPFREITLELEETGLRELEVAGRLDLDPTGAGPGDRLLVQVRARDLAGNDGLSRPFEVRVVPFTRGENERRRLAHLHWIRQAIHRARLDSAGEGEGAGETGTFSPESRDVLDAEASARDLPLSAPRDRAALLPILEREHHFTAHPYDKQDLRRLHGLLAAPGPPPEALTETLLPGLIDYRSLKNLLWQAFGLQAEARRLQAQFAALAEAQTPDPDRIAAAGRRAQLYRQTLEDLGDDMLERAAAHQPEEEVAALRDRQRDMNTAAFFMSRGGPGRRAEASAEVAAALGPVIDELRRALPRAFERYREARGELAARYARESERRFTALTTRDPAARSALADRLLDTHRLMGHDPFAPVWPRLRTLILLETALRRPPGTPAPDWLRHPPEQLAELIDRQRREAALQGFEARKSILADLELAPPERALELALLSLEWRVQVGEPLPENRLATLATEPRDTLPDTLPTPSPRQGRGPWPLAALAELAAAVRDLHPLRPRPGRLRELSQQFIATSDALATTFQGEGEADLGALATALTRDQQALHMLLAKMTADLMVPRDPAAEIPVRWPLGLLQLREATERYQARTGDVLTSLREASGREMDAGEMAGLQANLRQLTFLHRGLASRLEAIGAETVDEQTLQEQAERYPWLDALQRSRRYVALARRLEGPDPAAAATEMIEAFEHAGLQYLLARGGLLAQGLAALEQAQAALGEARYPAYHQALETAAAHLARFEEALGRAGEGPVQARLAPRLGQVRTDLRNLDLPDQPDDVAVSRRRFELGQVLRELRQLRRTLTGALPEGASLATGFYGGPEGLWRGPTRRDAEIARQRLLEQVRIAEQRITLGVLEALEAEPQPARYRQAAGWAGWLYRAVRGELAGAGVVRTGGGERAKPKDPHLEFLLEELDQAQQNRNLGAYERPTHEYLDLVRDHLRY